METFENKAFLLRGLLNKKEHNMKNAIIIFFEEDNYNSMHETLFHDLYDIPNVYFVTEKSFPNSILYRYLHSKKLKRITFGLSNILYIKLFFTYYKLPRVIRELKRDYDHISVLFHAAALRKPAYPIQYYKQLKKSASLNLLYLDIHDHLYTCREANDLVERGIFDKVFTIDSEDSKKYNTILCNTPYSKLSIKDLSKPDKQLYFCGGEANRAYMLYTIWKRAKEHEVRLEYDLARANQFMAFFEDDINVRFIDHLPYQEVLKRELSSVCLLDITQKNQSAFTLRPYEAVVYNKKLLTNNKNIKQFKYYDERYMRYFEKADDIDWDWVKEDIPVDYSYKGDFSPVYLLNKLA